MAKLQDVRPLKTPEQIEEMRANIQFAARNKPHLAARNLLIFNMGLNTGMRVSDIVSLKVADVKGKKKIVIVDQKTENTKSGRRTRKAHEVVFPATLRKQMTEYIKTLPKDQEYLFQSPKGNSHINPKHVYHFLNEAAELTGMEGIGTHSMRKTFGYMHYKQHKDVAKLMRIFNHSTQEITLRYIGMEAEEIENELEHFYI